MNVLSNIIFILLLLCKSKFSYPICVQPYMFMRIAWDTQTVLSYKLFTDSHVSSPHAAIFSASYNACPFSRFKRMEEIQARK